MLKALILTALDVEFEAVAEHTVFQNEIEDPVTGLVYDEAKFDSDNQSWTIFIAEIGAGNVNASNVSSRAVDFLKPDLMIFLGVAGGIKDTKLYDVVVGTKLYSYDSGKDEKSFKPRPALFNSSERVIGRSRVVRRRKKWLLRVKTDSLDIEPKAHIGPIAAGEKVVASTQSQSYRNIRKYYSDALAVEMEGYGALAGAQSRDNIFTVVIRGISDLIDDKASADASGSQIVASQTAAAFCFELLANLNLPNNQTDTTNTDDETSIALPSSPPKRSAPPAITPSDYTPEDKKEIIYTNMVPFKFNTETIHLAECAFTKPSDLINHTRQNNIKLPRDWLIHNKLIITPNDLSDPTWSFTYNIGTHEEHDFRDWSDSISPNIWNKFIYRCLEEKLARLFIGYNSRQKVFFFRPKRNRKPLKYDYQSIARKSSKTVFKGYSSSKDKSQISYYRHHAFSASIVKLESGNLMLITPTHYFTSNGVEPLANYEKKLKGIKKLEKNRSILGDCTLWSFILSQKHRKNSSKHYPHLTFSNAESLTLDKGITDSDWLPKGKT